MRQSPLSLSLSPSFPSFLLHFSGSHYTNLRNGWQGPEVNSRWAPMTPSGPGKFNVILSRTFSWKFPFDLAIRKLPRSPCHLQWWKARCLAFSHKRQIEFWTLKVLQRLVWTQDMHSHVLFCKVGESLLCPASLLSVGCRENYGRFLPFIQSRETDADII